MTLISKTGAGLSLISCFNDIHKTALIYSRNNYAKVMSDEYISDSIGNQKLNKVSHRDNTRKNWLFQKSFFNDTKEAFGKIGGYIKGFANGLANYMPNMVLSSIAMCAKNKYLANISTALLGGIELYDFIKNSTNIGERTDYLK